MKVKTFTPRQAKTERTMRMCRVELSTVVDTELSTVVDTRFDGNDDNRVRCTPSAFATLNRLRTEYLANARS